MAAIRKFIIVMIAAVMAVSPLAAQASSCLSDRETSMSSVCAHMDDCETNNVTHDAQADVDADKDHEGQNQHCATCCVAHVSVIIADLTTVSLPTQSSHVAIKLPRDWAGIEQMAPNALLRPPRA